MVLPQESSEPIGQGGAPAPAVHDPVPMQEPTPDTVPDPVVEAAPEPAPEIDLAQQLVPLPLSPCGMRSLTHDDAPTPASARLTLRLADVETATRPLHVTEHATVGRRINGRIARDGVLSAFDGYPDHHRTGRAGCIPRRVACYATVVGLQLVCLYGGDMHCANRRLQHRHRVC